MTLVRVPLTVASALAFHVAMSPPSTSEADAPDDRSLACTTARRVAAMLTKGLFWASALTDTLVVLAPYLCSPHACPAHLSPAKALLAWITRPTWALTLLPLVTALHFPFLPPLPLLTLAGTTLALAGASLQYAAYRALGRFYACPNRGTGACAPPRRGRGRGHAHALITTGPYAFVRHPGYAGLVLCTAGLAVIQVGDGVGFWGLTHEVAVGVGMRTVALACALMAYVGGLRQIEDEERSLKARFKGEWEAWAKKVPNRLIPGVY